MPSDLHVRQNLFQVKIQDLKNWDLFNQIYRLRLDPLFDCGLCIHSQWKTWSESSANLKAFI